jgi:hypothetical protein
MLNIHMICIFPYRVAFNIDAKLVSKDDKDDNIMKYTDHMDI